MSPRHEYVLDLSTLEGRVPPVATPGLRTREAKPSDAGALAELMIEAYRGTIDYDGESLQEASEEIAAFLAGQRGGRPWLNASRLAFAGPNLVGACLAAEWTAREAPVIAYIMTHETWKDRGIGRQLLWAVMQALRELEFDEVRAVITEGNIPSEQLLGPAGFRRVDEA